MLVSVVIPAYNSIYVRDAILSILNQTHRDLDVIVVDDDGAVLIPADLLENVLALAPEQERFEAWIMRQVDLGVPLPGLYPPNAENKARYDAEMAQSSAA